MTDGHDALPSDSSSRLKACAKQVEEELALNSDLSVVRLIDHIFEYALIVAASDIHINPVKSDIQVRVRIDGVLQDLCRLPLTIHGELISRLKILSGLRTDEHQAAQDGRLHVTRPNGTVVDVRISIVPLYYGENAVLRLLSNAMTASSLADLGFTKKNEAAVLSALQKPYGMILVTGPTGSGKTTTLYTLLTGLNTKETAVVTIEDPIEYAIDGVNQIQVQTRTGLSFATGLRSMLRQDPNTIMVGEIRDNETAGLAVNISLTGHLVLSTLHTNDAATTLPRLLDMKVEPYLIASTVNIAIGQRLVRQLCKHCREPYKVPPLISEEVTRFAGLLVVLPHSVVYRAVGCEKCNHTGYQGRIGIYEVLVMSPILRTLVLERASSQTLRQQAIAEGMTPLCIDGFHKVVDGITTIEEIFKLNYE